MPTTHVPDAIVYIPGLTGESVELTALRLAAALNRGAASPGADFQMGVGQDEVYDAELKLTTRLRPITRLEPGKDPLHIVDVYAFSYFETLTRDHVKSNELVKALRMALQFIRGVPRMIGAFFWHPQVSARAKAQYIAAILILLLLVVYLGVLVYAIVETIQQIPLVQTAFPAPAEASGDVDPATGAVGSLGWAQVIIIGTALLEAFFPQIRKAILDAAVKYLSVVGYLDHEEQLRAVGGQLNALMDRVAAKGYRHLYVVGFSFGSVIACNAFFPPGLQPAPRFREADALVTIGCPYDMITVFWPHYFAGRTIEAGVPKQWVNIYSPRDILASEFCRPATAAATNAQQPPARGWLAARTADIARWLSKRFAHPSAPAFHVVPNRNISWGTTTLGKRESLIGMLTLAGLEAHTTYWEEEYQADETAFVPIVAELYRETLRSPKPADRATRARQHAVTRRRRRTGAV